MSEPSAGTVLDYSTALATRSCQRCRAPGAHRRGLRLAGAAGFFHVLLCESCEKQARANGRYEVAPLLVIDGGLA